MRKFLRTALGWFWMGYHFSHFVLALYTHDYEQAAKEAVTLIMRLVPYVGKLWPR